MTTTLHLDTLALLTPYDAAALVLLALIGVVLFWIIDLIERLALPWHTSRRHDFVAAT